VTEVFSLIFFLAEQNTKNVKVYENFIYELNKRIDEIKNHSMNNSFLHAMKKKINSSVHM
jgi:cob(I)alamin adenosyltransferase